MKKNLKVPVKRDPIAHALRTPRFRMKVTKDRTKYDRKRASQEARMRVLAVAMG